MSFLDKHGLETLIGEIKNYALEKTSFELNKELIVKDPDTNNGLKIKAKITDPTKFSMLCLDVVIGNTQGQPDNIQTRTAKLSVVRALDSNNTEMVCGVVHEDSPVGSFSKGSSPYSATYRCLEEENKQYIEIYIVGESTCKCYTFQLNTLQ